VADNTNAIMENAEALTDAIKEVGLEVNRETKCMLMSHHQNAGQNIKQRQLIDHLKMWQSSNIWEWQ
jgi:hypothetical protein